MIFQLRRSDHITAFASLHWLRVPERIQITIAVLAYKVLHGTAPCYLGPLVRVSNYRVGAVTAVSALIAWSCRHSNCLLCTVEHL